MGRRAGIAAVIASGVAALVLTGTSFGLTAPAGAANPALRIHDASGTTGNWSGYVVSPQGGNVTAVTTTFKVPTGGLVLPGFAATWAGIGGFNGDMDLIQAGAIESSFPSNGLFGPQYFAWYEILPGAAVQLSNCNGDANCTVTPGDTLTVDIHQTATNVWTITMSDLNHWTWTKTDINYTSKHSSAEWILEAPDVSIGGLPTIPAVLPPLSGVGVAHFGPLSTYTVGSGRPQTIGSAANTSLAISPLGLGLFNVSTPSALAPDGQGFNVCAYAGSCAAPTS
ncbi:MAG TPA: G1 family glutamic endopeptidase [Acidimicrobiales bacterium]|jgi:hypothetical protein|nr:G1 family glutamic endopeptidase [Acidimicrobiales bacterium]